MQDRLIFGCGRIKGGLDEKHYRRLIDEALDLGITRFDVAPSYGLGMAEDVLGRSLHAVNAGSKIRIATKFGITRPGSPRAMTLARTLFRPLVTHLPYARKVALALAGSRSGKPVASLGGAELRHSLDDSLTRLRVSKVDALFLHEAVPEAALEGLSEAMAQLQNQGVIGSYGASTGGHWTVLPRFGQVMQCGARDIETLPAESRHNFNIHGLLREQLEPDSLVSGHKASGWLTLARKLDCDPAGGNWQAGALLALASIGYGCGGIIFSTNSRDRLKATFLSYQRAAKVLQLEPRPAVASLTVQLFSTAAAVNVKG